MLLHPTLLGIFVAALLPPLLLPLRYLALYSLIAGGLLGYIAWDIKFNPTDYDSPGAIFVLVYYYTLVEATIIGTAANIFSHLIKKHVRTRFFYLAKVLGLLIPISFSYEYEQLRQQAPSAACQETIIPVRLGQQLLNVPMSSAFAFFNNLEIAFTYGNQRTQNIFCLAQKFRIFPRKAQHMLIHFGSLVESRTYRPQYCGAPGRYRWIDEICNNGADAYVSSMPEYIQLSTSYINATNKWLFDRTKDPNYPFIEKDAVTEELLANTIKFRLSNGDIVGSSCQHWTQYHCDVSYLATADMVVNFTFDIPYSATAKDDALTQIELYYPRVKSMIETLLPH